MEPYWVRALYELPNCCELGVHYKRVVAEERPDVSGIISSLRTVVEVSTYWPFQRGNLISFFVSKRKNRFSRITIERITV